MKKDIYISIVLPVYNEENNITSLVKEIILICKNKTGKKIEIIVVDDASTDGSVHAIQTLQEELITSGRTCFGDIVIDRLPVRSGQSAAIMAGMKDSSGEFILTMDSDMQHDPSDIPVFMEAVKDADMVCGIRKHRSDGPARLFCSKIANVFRNWITGDSTSDSGCTFRMMKKECLPALVPVEGNLYGCEFFFHPILVSNAGFKVSEVKVCHHARPEGKSHYNLMRGRFWRGIKACFKVRSFLNNK